MTTAATLNEKAPAAVNCQGREETTVPPQSNIASRSKLCNAQGVTWIDFLNERYELNLTTSKRCASPLRQAADNQSSFQLNDDGTWHDFGAEAEAHGDVYSFIMQMEGCQYRDAYKIFHCRYPEDGTTDFSYQHTSRVSNNIAKTLTLAADYCHGRLMESPAALDYLKNRRIDIQTMKNLKIGYVDDSQKLEDYLRLNGHNTEHTGLFLDNMKDRVIFPYHSLAGSRVLYLIGRKLDDAVPGAKYVKMKRSGNEEVIRHPPYGLRSINGRNVNRIVLAEGVLDAVTLIQEGEAVLASCGGCFSHEQMQEIIRTVKELKEKNPGLEIIVWMDYDPESETGQRSTIKLADELMRNKLFCRIVTPTGAMLAAKLKVDVNSLYCTQGRGTLIRTLETAVPYLDKLIDDVRQNSDRVARNDAGLALVSKLAEAGCEKDEITYLLKDLKLSADSIKKNTLKHGITPQKVAASITSSGNVVSHNGCIYMRESRGYVSKTGEEASALLRRELEHSYGTCNIKTDMISEAESAMRHKSAIPADSQACYIQADQNGWVNAEPIPDPVLVFPKSTIRLSAPGPELIDSGKKVFSPLFFNYDYNYKATCPLWLKSLGEYIPDPAAVELLQEYAGFLFYPNHTEIQAFMVLLGLGGNGKGTVMRTISEMLGKRLCGPFTLGSFLDSHSTSLLVGKRLIQVSEVDRYEETSVAAIKNWTGGDPVKINPKNRELFNYMPEGKMIISCNDRPHLTDHSNAIWRRLLVIDFPNVITKQDGTIEAKLKEELPGIMNWAIEGYYRLKAKKAWDQSNLPKSTLHLREEICRDGDPFRRWASDTLVESTNPKDSLKVEHAYSNYTAWIGSNGYRSPLNKQTFSTRLKNKIGKEPSHGGNRFYSGWKFAEAPSQPF